MSLKQNDIIFEQVFDNIKEIIDFQIEIYGVEIVKKMLEAILEDLKRGE